MLQSLHIRNFKVLKNFSIKTLGQVNLLVGKNNVGKSSILEAVDLYASRFDLVHIIEMLSLRKEDMSAFKVNPDITSEDEVASVLPFVTERSLDTLINEGISVGEIGKELTIKLARCTRQNKETGVEFSLSRLDNDIIDNNVALVLEKEVGKYLGIIATLDGGGLKSTFKKTDLPKYPVKILSSRESRNEKEMLTESWGQVSMSELEPYVVKSLQIIDHNITRFNIMGTESVPYVSIRKSSKPIRLYSMGDGLNKILRIILSMLSCKDGILLVDEIENGLHYTVTDKLWKLIFDISKKLNVQVIATTHSNDCVMSFIKANDENGNLIRVEAQSDKLVSTAYDLDEMKYILERMNRSQMQTLDIR